MQVLRGVPRRDNNDVVVRTDKQLHRVLSRSASGYEYRQALRVAAQVRPGE